LGDDTGRSGYLPLLPGVKHIRYNYKADLEQIDPPVAAVIVEPIQAEAGIIEPREDFLKDLRERCNSSGALLILDEIQTGMGRTGKLFAFEHYGITPDILCLAKSFGGGMPLGAFIASKEIMSKLTFDPPLGHITTFGGHPVCCAAGLAAQREVEEHSLMDHALQMELKYREGLDHPKVKEIRGKGLFLGVQLAPPVDIGKFISKAFDNGLIMDQFLFSDDSFRIAPPLIITSGQVDLTIQKIRDTIDAITK
jgi:acetylornithine/succinyldiaminopimelate/putrescine aminotransferase